MTIHNLALNSPSKPEDDVIRVGDKTWFTLKGSAAILRAIYPAYPTLYPRNPVPAWARNPEVAS